MNNLLPFIRNGGISLPVLPTSNSVNDLEQGSVNCPRASMEKLSEGEEEEDETEAKVIVNGNRQNSSNLKRRSSWKRLLSKNSMNKKKEEKEKQEKMKMIFKVDIVARFIFPLSYLLFTIVYVVYYYKGV